MFLKTYKGVRLSYYRVPQCMEGTFSWPLLWFSLVAHIFSEILYPRFNTVAWSFTLLFLNYVYLQNYKSAEILSGEFFNRKDLLLPWHAQKVRTNNSHFTMT